MYEKTQETSWIRHHELLRMTQIVIWYPMADVPSQAPRAFFGIAGVTSMESVNTQLGIKDMLGDLGN